ncbi:hypothetical protein Moror_3264, partial [Moniliophthora roreri MCA 2997]
MSIVQPDLGDTFGANLVATIISSCLYGVTCLQTWYYFQNYSDSILIRATVLAILALETIHEILLTEAAYHYLILNYGNPLALLTHTWSTILIGPATVRPIAPLPCLRAETEMAQSAIATIVFMFYAVRIYLLSHKRDWWTPAIVCVLNVAQTALSIALAVGMAKHRFFAVITTNKQSIAIGIAPLFCNAAGDVICAVALSYYLHSNRSGIKSTDTRINKLIIHAINNGVLTVVAAISTVVFAIAKPKNLVYQAVFQVVGNLYANSLLSTLNSRNIHVKAFLPVSVDSSHLDLAFRPASETSRLTQAADTLTIDIAKILNEPEPVARRDQQYAGSFGMEVNPERG